MTDFKLSCEEKQFLISARDVAQKLNRNGRALTGIIGELSACEKLELKWVPQDGYDAEGPNKTKYQIKTRKNWTLSNEEKDWWKKDEHRVDPNGRMGRFQGKTNYDFGFGLYVELDEKFEVWGIWRIDKSKVKKLEKNHNRGLHINTFKKNSCKVYPKDRP